MLTKLLKTVTLFWFATPMTQLRAESNLTPELDNLFSYSEEFYPGADTHERVLENSMSIMLGFLAPSLVASIDRATTLQEQECAQLNAQIYTHEIFTDLLIKDVLLNDHDLDFIAIEEFARFESNMAEHRKAYGECSPPAKSYRECDKFNQKMDEIRLTFLQAQSVAPQYGFFYNHAQQLESLNKKYLENHCDQVMSEAMDQRNGFGK